MTETIRRAGPRYPLADLDLCIWERDCHFCAPYHLYIVLGDPPGRTDYPAKVIAQISRAITSYGQRVAAAASDLIPIRAFGLVAEPYSGEGLLQLRLEQTLTVDAQTSDGRIMTWHRHTGMAELDLSTVPHRDFREMMLAAAQKVAA